MAKQSYSTKNAHVWNIAGYLFLLAGIIALIGEKTTYALGSLAIALAFFAISYDLKKKRNIS